MLMPALLPEKLLSYQSAESPKELHQRLAQVPDEYIEFMLVAFEDETWCSTFSAFTREALRWASEQSYLGRISPNSAKSLAQGVQPHYQNLMHYLPYNLMCEVAGETIVINSLLFQGSSPFWLNLIRTQCQEKRERRFSLPNVTLPQFTILREFIYTGEVKELWRLKEAEIYTIFKVARGFELVGLAEECEQLLLRYITPLHVFEFLTFADTYGLTHIRERCYDYLNAACTDISFTPTGASELICELKKSTEASLGEFAKLADYITHFIALNGVMEDQGVIALLQRCPRLCSLDLGHTAAFIDKMRELRRFKELILAGCKWLKDSELKKILTSYPQIEKLDLGSCLEITATGWGELTNLPKLVSLSLARCDKLTDQELELILISARRLRELSLGECRELSDAGFHALAAAKQQFTILDLNRTGILDRNLLEITSRLSSLVRLDVARCQNLTEQGILDAIKIAPSISEVNLEHTRISSSAIEALKRIKPFLQIKI